jgi:hypothetical protein
LGAPTGPKPNLVFRLYDTVRNSAVLKQNSCLPLLEFQCREREGEGSKEGLDKTISCLRQKEKNGIDWQEPHETCHGTSQEKGKMTSGSY